jgi:hypothetical protein
VEGDLDDEQRRKPIEERLRSSELRRPKTRARNSLARSAIWSSPHAASVVKARICGGVAARACIGSPEEAKDEGEEILGDVGGVVFLAGDLGEMEVRSSGGVEARASGGAQA